LLLLKKKVPNFLFSFIHFWVIQHPNILNDACTRLNRYNDDILFRDRRFLNKRSRKKKNIIVLNTHAHTHCIKGGKICGGEEEEKKTVTE
jgi:hypothetical protein